MSRSYRQYCGLARALDVVGDRWNLLVVRQLLIAPARYRDLIEGLPGVATNLLSDRLGELENAGVVERRLAEHGKGVVYALTPWGAELREPVEALIRWSTPMMVRGADGDKFQPEWLLVALRALLTPRRAGRRSWVVGLAVDDALIQVRTTRSGLDVRMHDGRALDAVVRGDAAVVLGLAAGGLTVDGAAALIEVEGDTTAVQAVFDAR